MTGTTIPSTVTNIGANAFADCTNLTSVTIPAGVTSIGEEAFALCASLKAITVDAQNSCYSSTNGVLFDKSQTTLLQYPGGAVGSYTIPASVTSIADGAFLGCLVLTNVTIPASVTNIGTNAFYLCSGLAAITVDASNALYSSLNGVLFDKNQTTLIHYPGGIVGGYTIPAEVTNILDDAFDAPYSYDPMTNLTSVIIPGSVASIGANTFQYHTGLTNVTIADGVTSIASNAFDYCLGLTSVTIPGSVTSIANFAFESCENLTSVFFTGDAPPVPSSAFDYDNATVYYLPGATGWSTNFAGLPAVLWNPVIQTGDGSFGVQTNQFGFNVTGATNIPVLVEACDDLSCGVWSPLQAVALTNGSFYFSEPVQTNGAGRYYRLGSP
jgi:hypothetical protein